MFTALAFFGMNEIGISLQNPFGDDENDIDLNLMTRMLRDDIWFLLDRHGHPIPALSQPTHPMLCRAHVVHMQAVQINASRMHHPRATILVVGCRV